jgi:nucleotide-binding universal stress UspA family protein
MAAKASHKLNNALEGALAGGGDPATSPLYVFGPFLRLIVVAGVAQVTFGASIWLVILTIAVVSTMYRLVMQWVTDGSGGSGLSEEEFGGWAVKVNAAITFVEYTLTFLVSMAAMVTFIADRIPVLNEGILWIQYRTLVAIALSILTGWLVNRGPKMAARTFGPATAGVLMLLWLMVFSTLWRFGLRLPDFNLQAFDSSYLNLTLNGYARILAVMTGIEVFANLVAAYDGTPGQKSRRAFYSLMIIMGTTAVTMLVVGPAIFNLSDPTNEQVSVFTQTMDVLLPAPLPYLGTMVGIAVLMSASAASAQGLQNLALGLNERHYIPYVLGQRNEFEVADRPVWIEVGIVSVCFFAFGTHEETYLALYAAGVFILLSMTGWAVTKRLVREMRAEFSLTRMALIAGTVFAAALTTGATLIIFEERFFEGAWTYLIFIPALYAVFTYFRNRLGEPTAEADYMGLLDSAQLAGFGFGQYPVEAAASGEQAPAPVEITWQPEPIEHSRWRERRVDIKRLLVLLDGSSYAERALGIARVICKNQVAQLSLLSAYEDGSQTEGDGYRDLEIYLGRLQERLQSEEVGVDYAILPGSTAEATENFINTQIEVQPVDLVVTSVAGKSGASHWLTGGLSRKLVRQISIPVLLVQPDDDGQYQAPGLDTIVVALDGSIKSEGALPYARALAKGFGSQLVLVSVPAVPQPSDYRSVDDLVENLRAKAEVNMGKFLEAVARALRGEGLDVRTVVSGSIPARTIVDVSEAEGAGMIILTTHGRGGMDFLFIGSVAERVVQRTQKLVMMVPITETGGSV